MIYISYQRFWLNYSSFTTLKLVLFFLHLLIDDDIDDEEFYDDHLEAYFEQLAIPGMIYEDLEGQELPEKDFRLPIGDLSLVCSSYYVFQEFDIRKLLLVSLDTNIKLKLLVFLKFCFSLNINRWETLFLLPLSITQKIKSIVQYSQCVYTSTCFVKWPNFPPSDYIKHLARIQVKHFSHEQIKIKRGWCVRLIASLRGHVSLFVPLVMLCLII